MDKKTRNAKARPKASAQEVWTKYVSMIKARRVWDREHPMDQYREDNYGVIDQMCLKLLMEKSRENDFYKKALKNIGTTWDLLAPWEKDFFFLKMYF